VDGGLRSPDCTGETIPTVVTGKLDKAVRLIEQANTAPRKAKRVLKQARRLLTKAAKTATKLSTRKRPVLSPGCAASIRQAADGVRGGLGT
jgi:hypothetical protein